MTKYNFSDRLCNISLWSLFDIYKSLTILIARVGLDSTFKCKDVQNLPHSLQTLRSYGFIVVDHSIYNTVFTLDGNAINLTQEEYDALPCDIKNFLDWHDYFEQQTRKVNIYKFDVNRVVSFMEWVKPIIKAYKEDSRYC